MEEKDIELLLEKGIWVSCRPFRKKWEFVVYKRKTTGWVKRKRKLFTHPAAAYDWAINYLAPMFNDD
tara:strand:+ start:6159 stop:6359 length:201 start_codon:yes stop_codon:yes gene_type:complete